MVKVSGDVKLSVRYDIELKMTADEFEALSESKQNQLIEEAIDWHDALRSARTDDIDVWDIE